MYNIEREKKQKQKKNCYNWHDSVVRDDAVDNEAEEADEKENETPQSSETATVKFGQPDPSESSVEKSGAENPKPTPRTQPLQQREKTSLSLGSLGSGKSARMKKQEAEVRRSL